VKQEDTSIADKERPCTASGRWLWRAALESPHTGERQAFADLPGLFAYLEQRTSSLDLLEPSEDQPDEE
jgi:hypothetical protein